MDGVSKPGKKKEGRKQAKNGRVSGADEQRPYGISGFFQYSGNMG
jgi:hypothetical protein